MSDVRSIVAATTKLRASGTPFVCATVVRVRGSSYRRPGARLIATSERRIAGCVSGGCLERDLLRTSWWRTQRGPVVVRYDSTDEIGPQASLGCGGEVDVLLERAGEQANDPMTVVERALASEDVSGLATVYESSARDVPIGTRFCLTAQGIASSLPVAGSISEPLANACERVLASRRTESIRGEGEGGSFEALVESIVPPPHLFVFGAGEDAVPVVLSASRLGWNVTVWESSPRTESRARLAKTDASYAAGEIAAVRAEIDACAQPLAIVMSHDIVHDRVAVSMLLDSRAQYIGVLGPRHRTSRLASVEALADPRVHAPVGLDLGAETPEEIALSVTAEMLAVLRRGTGASLRTRPALHVR